MSRTNRLANQPTLGLRSVVAVAILAAELLGISVRFDTGSLAGETGWWAAVTAQAPLLVQLAITLVVTSVLFCGSAFLDEMAKWPVLAGTGWGCVARLSSAHAAAVVCTYRFTEVLLERGDRAADPMSLWFLGWVGAAAVAVATLALAVLPARSWYRLAVRLWPSLLVAAAVSLAAWGSGLISERLWEPLAHWTLWTVRALLSLVIADPFCSPDGCRVGTGTFSVRIAPGCSGYEGIGLVLGFAGGYLWMSRSTLRFPHALLLLPLGAVLAWGANAARITVLILIGTWGSREVALGGFHSQAGWLAFNGIAFGLALLTHRLRLFHAPTAGGNRPPSPAGPDATTSYLAPFLVQIATAMATAAVTAGFDWCYPVRVVAVAGVLWYFRRSYPRLRWSWAAVATGLAVFGAWIALAPPAGVTGPPTELAALPPGWAAAWIVFRIVGSCMTVPLAEELAFRGCLTRRLIASRFDDVPPGTFTWSSFLVSSVLFGVIHGQWLAGILAGLVYALMYYRRRELSDAVLAHATTNAALAAWVLATGHWHLWL